jgi:hypothetical protein
MAKYLCRSCPRCSGYVDIVLREPGRNTRIVERRNTMPIRANVLLEAQKGSIRPPDCLIPRGATAVRPHNPHEQRRAQGVLLGRDMSLDELQPINGHYLGCGYRFTWI